MKEKLIRDVIGSPVPQYFNLDLQMFAVNTLDGSVVTNGDIDFSKTKLIRDRLGSPVPQVWNVANNSWVVVTSQNSSGAHTHNISDIDGLQGKLDEIMRMIQNDGNDGGNEDGNVENNTWLEVFTVDDYNLLGLEKFDATQVEWEPYGDGSNEYAIKPKDPLVKFIKELPTSFTIKLKEEYKDVEKYINFYNSAGHYIGYCSNENFDENGLAVITKANIAPEDRLFENETIYIEFVFRAPDATETSGSVYYWIELIYDGEWTAPQSWLSEFKIGEVNALELEGIQLMSGNTLNIAAEVEYTEKNQYTGLTLRLKRELLNQNITLKEYYDDGSVGNFYISDVSNDDFRSRIYPDNIKNLTIRISSGEEVQNYGVKFVSKA